MIKASEPQRENSSDLKPYVKISNPISNQKNAECHSTIFADCRNFKRGYKYGVGEEAQLAGNTTVCKALTQRLHYWGPYDNTPLGPQRKT